MGGVTPRQALSQPIAAPSLDDRKPSGLNCFARALLEHLCSRSSGYWRHLRGSLCKGSGASHRPRQVELLAASAEGWHWRGARWLKGSKCRDRR